MTLPPDLTGPFDVKTEDLIRIEAGQAVDLFRQLLVIEAAGAGIPITSVNVPADINVPDGGVDADVATAFGAVLPAGLITEGQTYYQIKTGKFSASTASEVRSLLLKPAYAKEKTPTRDHWQPRVLSCFERGGTFVAVLFGTDLVGVADDHGVTQIKAAITSIEPAFADAKVRVLRANQLCTAITRLAPGLALRLRGVGGDDQSPINDLQFLGECCGLELDSYQVTPELGQASAQITQMADDVVGLRHIRVLGDTGAGKTHLIYRALSASKLKGCVLYSRDADQLYDSGPLDGLSQMSRDTTIILFADECELETATALMATFKRRAKNMLLITADNVTEAGNAHTNVEVIDVPRLEQPVIAEIFKGYGIADDGAEWLANLCAGSPRAAHRLGEYIKAHPDQQPSQQLGHLDDFWKQIVCSPDGVDSVAGREKLVVLRTLALFRQVAWQGAEGGIAQAAVLHALQLLDQNFSKLALQNAVSKLLKKRILQGQRTLLISPKLLHVAMWKGWFDEYMDLVNVLELRAGFSERMQSHFDDMLDYARESRAATGLAERLLGPGGPFARLEGFAQPSDAKLFFAVAQANPKAALRRFARALETETVEVRAAFAGDSRRTAVHRLEQLAVPTETFFEAAECLLLLAEGENESWSNNATGVFVSLFTLGYGGVAASELSPVAKIAYLRSLLGSNLAFRRTIAIRALSESLSPFLSRTAVEETIGLRRLPDRWTPVTYSELFDAYGAHVGLLEEAADRLSYGEADLAAQGILDHVRNLILIEPLAYRVVSFVRRAAAKPSLRDKCIETLVSTLHYEGKSLPAELVQVLEALRAELTESSFTSRLRRHAGMKLLEDHFDETGNYSDEEKPELAALAREACSSLDLLLPELEWLVTEEAKNGYAFGSLLGQDDRDLKVWPLIYAAWLKAGDRRSDFFIGGYLSAWFAIDSARWESLLTPVFEDKTLRGILPAVVWRSGINDRVARRLLALAQSGEIDPKEFRRFVYGSVVVQLPLDVVDAVVDLLIEAGDLLAADCALDIVSSRLRARPADVSAILVRLERLLNAPVFVEGTGKGVAANNMVLYHWNEAAMRLLEQDVDAATRLARRCFEHFGGAGSVTSGYLGEPLKFLIAAARARPAEVWASVVRQLADDDIGGKGWRMLRWLRGNISMRESVDAGIDAFPVNLIFEWVDGDTERRARLLAENCPPLVSLPDEPPTLARLLLSRYGSSDKVRRAMHANHFTGFWWGKPSDHFRDKLAKIEQLLTNETDPNVRIWLREHFDQLERTIAVELEREQNDEF